jgi:hypothetical protein
MPTSEFIVEPQPNNPELKSREDPSAIFRVPMDICEWVPSATVISWIHEELKSLGAAEQQGSHSPLDATGGAANVMLAVLAFAYVRGIFDTEETARLCHSDPQFQSLSRGQAISPAGLIAFRPRDRGLLVKLTAQLLIRAATQKLNLPGSALAPGLKRQLHADAVLRLDTARHFDRGDMV